MRSRRRGAGRTGRHGAQALRYEGLSATQRIFCLVFGACCNTLAIVVCELLGALSFAARLAALRVHVVALVLFMLCGLPR